MKMKYNKTIFVAINRVDFDIGQKKVVVSKKK